VYCADTGFPALQEPDDAQPRGVRQRFEQSIQRLQVAIHIRLDKYTGAGPSCLYSVIRIQETAMEPSIKTAVPDKYGAIASGVSSTGCCGGSCADPITSGLYDAAEKAGLPAEA